MTTERNPFTAIISKNKTITSGITTLTRAPYTNGQYYKIRKIDITTFDSGASGYVWKFWDQDLSSTTAGTVGSASSALLLISPGFQTAAPVSGLLSGFTAFSVNRTADQLPSMPFYAGITVHSINPASINLELEIC